MLEMLRRVLDYKFTVAELIGIALIIGTPYLLIGVVWSGTHTEHLKDLDGIDLVVSFLGSIVSWPVLLLANVCMT
ncbi:hypothetical protein ACAG26_10110 [Mycobacterium sp. pUA109]